MERRENRSKNSEGKRHSGNFWKSLFLVVLPASALSLISGVGYAASGPSLEPGIFFVFVWPLAVIAFIVSMVVGFTRGIFKTKSGRAGLLAGAGIAVIALGAGCFSLISPPTPAATAPITSVPLPLPPSTTAPTTLDKGSPATTETSTPTVPPVIDGESPTSPYSSPPQLSLGSAAADGLNVTINGVTLPGKPGATITRIWWEWGDGTTEDHWFPASHSYRTPGSYTVKITSFQSDSQFSTKSVLVQVGVQKSPDTLVTYSGVYSGFYAFPSRFFEESIVPAQDVLKLTDAQYLSLKKMHNGISPYSSYRIEYEASFYGATMPHGIKLGDAAFPGLNSGNPRWDVMAHEQGHNFFGGTSAFYSTLATPYPFLQESLAVLSAFYTYHDIRDNKNAYDINDISINSLDFNFTEGRAYQKSMFDKYLSDGKHFDVSQVLTSQALDYKMITFGETYGWQNFQRLSRAFENNIGNRFTFHRDGVSPVEQSTYIVAALSVAFGQDLRQQFRDLNFPIDDTLHGECISTIDAYIEGR